MIFKIAPKAMGPSPLPQDLTLGDPQPDPGLPPDPEQPQGGGPQDLGGQSPEGQDSPGQVDPSIAGYMGPEYGPFECDRCVHWLDPNACGIVAGNIDPHGCCNLFTPQSDQQEGEQGPDEGVEQPQQPQPPQGAQQ